MVTMEAILARILPVGGLSRKAGERWSSISGQEISPRLIAGQIGENVIINCTSHFPNEALNNVLRVYIPARNQFQLFEGSDPRLIRSDAGSVTTYTFGPLETSDNGTILRCSSSGLNSANATIVVTFTAPPPQVQALCSVAVWYDPEPVFCGDTVGYDVRFFHPELLVQNVTRRVGANGTFYIIQEEDGLAMDARQKDLYVQVRVIHKIDSGEWSDGISLGCEGPTSPPEVPRVHFVLNGVMYTNNSAVPLSEVGESENALLCKTDKEDCRGTPPNRFGEFYYPADIKVPIAKEQQGFYRNRGEKVVRLNRRDGTTSPTGRYRCEVPDAKGSMQNIYITLS